jgi:hypothetical protein
LREVNQNDVWNFKVFRNFAAWFAIVIPAVSLVCFLTLIETKNTAIISFPIAAWIFISSIAMGILSLFGKSVEPGIRALVFVGILISAVFGGFAIIACFFSRLGC